jgi:hypothetical protein
VIEIGDRGIKQPLLQHVPAKRRHQILRVESLSPPRACVEERRRPILPAPPGGAPDERSIPDAAMRFPAWLVATPAPR